MEQALRQGLVLIDNNQYQEAHRKAISLIRDNPHDPVPYFLLARVAADHQNYAKAEELYRRAQQLGPNNPLYCASLAQLLVTLGRHGQALELADEAAALPLDDAFIADTIGVTYSRTGFHEKAVPFFKQAVALNPKPGNFHYNLGASLQFSGHFEQAETAYRDAITRQPDNYRAYSSLVGLSRQTPDTQRLDVLEDLYEQHRDNPDAALHFGHAIAKTLEDLEQYPESFHWLQAAKANKRQQLDYNVETDLALFDAAAKTRAAASSAPVSDGHQDAAPIFVVGLPRTGTTLIDRVLSSHPDVVSAGELNHFAGLIKDHAGTESSRVLDPATLDALLNPGQQDLAAIGRAYIASTQDLRRGARRFTDKMPLNFFYAGLIHQALPQARIVVLRRHPMDSCLSNFRQLFSTGFSYYNYALDLADTARYYLAFDALMAHWRNVLPAQRLMEIHYEEMVLNQQDQTARLLEFCGLPWHENCLNFHSNAAPVSTASSVQVRQKLYTSAINRWKKYGDCLDPLRRSLGHLFDG